MQHDLKRSFFLFLGFFLVLPMANGQEVISSGGASKSNSQSSISYTIGEPVSGLVKSPQVSVLQGYQQSSYVVTTLIESPSIHLSINAYPNPLVDRISIDVKSDDAVDLFCRVVDLNAQIIFTSKLKSGITDLDFSRFPSGSYIISLLKNNVQLKSFKVVKQ